MAAPRLDYPDTEIVTGTMIELVSALISLTAITRPVTHGDIDHAKEHVLAAMELVKRQLKREPTR